MPRPAYIPAQSPAGPAPMMIVSWVVVAIFVLEVRAVTRSAYCVFRSGAKSNPTNDNAERFLRDQGAEAYHPGRGVAMRGRPDEDLSRAARADLDQARVGREHFGGGKAADPVRQVPHLEEEGSRGTLPSRERGQRRWHRPGAGSADRRTEGG